MRRATTQPIRSASLLALALVPLLAAALAWTGSVGRATSDASPYTIPEVVDADPAANVVETTIVADEATVDIGGGVLANAQTFNGSIPGPTFRLKVGDTVIVHFRNELADEATGIHWHGIELANAMDGTPLTQNQVPSGRAHLYKFTVTRPGVYWYHPHHHTATNQVFKGLYGMILVEDPSEPALIAAGTLPTAAQTLPVMLSDTTVCKQPGHNDAATYDPGLPWVGGGPLPVQAPPTPVVLCETTPIDVDGEPRLPVPGPFGAGDIPNIQQLPTAPNQRTNEGQTVLSNGMSPGGRGGSPAAPGALAPGAATRPVLAGQGLRLQLANAATVRFFRLRLTTSTGTVVPLIRVGGEGGLLDGAVLEGGVSGGFDTQIAPGEIVLAPGARADVVAPIPPAATGVLTLWTADYQRTGEASGFTRTPTVPVMHLDVSGTAPSTFAIAPGTPLRAATGDPVETLPAATGALLDPATFTPAKPGLGAAPDITFTNAGGLGINGVVGTHPSGVDYTQLPALDSTRWATSGDVVEMRVTNTTNARHPFHMHGFSIQPISLTKAGGPDLSWPYREFRDNVEVPPGYTLTYRVRFEARPLADDATPGGELGRWVLHCHIFFHHANGMISEIVVVPSASGNEKPFVDADATRASVVAGSRATMTGTFADPDGDAVTLTASRGTVTPTGAGTWSWSAATAASDAGGLVYVTATDGGGRRDQAVFQLDVRPAPALALAPASATSLVGTRHAVTATLANVDPLAGRPILFAVSGAHAAAGSAATSATGAASFSYAGTNAGQDAIVACHDADASGACDAGELTARATTTWSPLLAPPPIEPAGLDHFKCYRVTPTTIRARSVTLRDQFGTRRSRTVRRQALCNPVSKDGGRILNRSAHLTCYATRDRGPAVRSRRVRVTNQLGTRVLVVRRPQSLCVPSLKRVVAARGATRPPAGRLPTARLDHFRCYAVTPQAARRTVTLRDQFGTTRTRLVQVLRLCNPVGKRHGGRLSGVRRPRAHLVCYAIRDADAHRRRRVIVRNQLEARRFGTVRSTQLCLPSLKRVL